MLVILLVGFVLLPRGQVFAATDVPELDYCTSIVALVSYDLTWVQFWENQFAVHFQAALDAIALEQYENAFVFINQAFIDLDLAFSWTEALIYAAQSYSDVGCDIFGPLPL